MSQQGTHWVHILWAFSIDMYKLCHTCDSHTSDRTICNIAKMLCSLDLFSVVRAVAVNTALSASAAILHTLSWVHLAVHWKLTALLRADDNATTTLGELELHWEVANQPINTTLFQVVEKTRSDGQQGKAVHDHASGNVANTWCNTS